jgi:hypothetical protein
MKEKSNWIDSMLKLMTPIKTLSLERVKLKHLTMESNLCQWLKKTKKFLSINKRKKMAKNHKLMMKILKWKVEMELKDNSKCLDLLTNHMFQDITL